MRIARHVMFSLMMLLPLLLLAGSPAMSFDETYEQRARRERSEVIAAHRRALAPPPIDAAEIGRWSDLFKFDDEQKDAMSIIEQEYFEACQALKAGPRRIIVVNWPAMFHYDETTRTMQPRYTPLLIEVLRARQTLLAEMERNDDRLFADTRVIISPNQYTTLDQIHWRVTRELYAMASDFLEADLDLQDVVRSVELDAEEYVVLAPLLLKYQEELAAQTKTRAVGVHDLDLERARMLIDLGERWELVVHEQERFDIRQELNDITRDQWNTALAIGDLNRETFRRVRKLLTTEHARTLTQQYHRRVRPTLYEQETEILSHFDEAKQLPDLGDDVAEAIDAMRDRAMRALNPLGLDAMEIADQIFVDERLDEPDAVIRLEHEIELIDVEQQRREMMSRALFDLEQLLLSSHPEFVRKLIFPRDVMTAQARVSRYRRDTLAQRIEQVLDIEEADAIAAQEAEEAAEDDGSIVDEVDDALDDGGQ